MLFWNKKRENQLEDSGDFENNSSKSIEFRFGDYVELHDYIPPSLIIRKGINETERDITIFDLIAKVNKLEYCERNVYQNNRGNYFIRTKYGFQPMVAYNKGLQLRDKNNLIEGLNADLINLESDNKLLVEKIQSLQLELQEKRNELINQKKYEALNQKVENIRNQMEEFRLMYTQKKQEVKELKAEKLTLQKILISIQKQMKKFSNE